MDKRAPRLSIPHSVREREGERGREKGGGREIIIYKERERDKAR
jgi:hypothetical protein